MSFISEKTLKSDAFGSIERGAFKKSDGQQIAAIKRVYTKNLCLRWFAKFLSANEKRAIKRLQPMGFSGFPDLLEVHKDYHVRSFIQGGSMHHAVDRLSHEYFLEAKKLLKVMRESGVTNNDLAKEANWLVDENGMPAVTDFQLSLCFPRRPKLFLVLCREDLRHLLKHKRKYATVTAQEIQVLNKRSLVSRIWKNTGKRLHYFVTRKILGWEDRNGPEERDI